MVKIKSFAQGSVIMGLFVALTSVGFRMAGVDVQLAQTVDFIALFQNFGYPALMSAVLMYVLIYRLEQIRTQMERRNETLTEVKGCLSNIEDEIKEIRRGIPRGGV